MRLNCSCRSAQLRARLCHARTHARRRGGGRSATMPQPEHRRVHEYIRPPPAVGGRNTMYSSRLQRRRCRWFACAKVSQAPMLPGDGQQREHSQPSCDVEALQPQARLVRLDLDLAVDLPLLNHAGIAHLLRFCEKQAKDRAAAVTIATAEEQFCRTGERINAITHQGKSNKSSSHSFQAWEPGNLPRLRTFQSALARC